MRPQANTNLIIPNRDGVIPITATPGWRTRNLVDIINKNIDPACFLTNLLKQPCDVIVITVITPDSMTFTASLSDLARCRVDGSITVTDSSACRVYSTALLCQCQSNPFAYSST
jgi:hypothetical protein